VFGKIKYLNVKNHLTNVHRVGKITIANVKIRSINKIYIFNNLTIPFVMINFKKVFGKGGGDDFSTL